MKALLGFWSCHHSFPVRPNKPWILSPAERCSAFCIALATNLIQIMRKAGAAMLIGLTSAQTTALANPQSVQEGEPVEIEQAFATATGKLTLETSAEYTTISDGTKGTVWQVGPEIEYGVLNGLQMTFGPTYNLGARSEGNSGAAETHLLYQFNDQGPVVPALAADVSYATPYGAGEKSSQYAIRALASKWLGSSPNAPRIHLNLTFTSLGQPEPGTRRNQLQAAIGGSVMLGGQAALVADIVCGQTALRRQNETWIDIGYRRDLPRDWELSLGVGRQVLPSSGARVFFSLEKEFYLF
jgi:hypothetical protein